MKKPNSISFKPTNNTNKPCTTIINGGLNVKKDIIANCDLDVKKCLGIKNINYTNTEIINSTNEIISNTKSISYINTNGTGILDDGIKDGFYKKIIKVADCNGWESISGNNDLITGGINDIKFKSNGEGPYIGGSFLNAGGIIGLNRLAKWNGNSWTSVNNATISSGFISVIRFNPNNEDEIYVGGSFTNFSSIAGLNRLAKWGGTSVGWTSVDSSGDEINRTIRAINFSPSGTGPYIGGNFNNQKGIGTLDYFSVWNGSNWGSVRTGGDFVQSAGGLLNNKGVYTIEFDENENIYVGGRRIRPSGFNVQLRMIFKWVVGGSRWTSVNLGIDGNLPDNGLGFVRTIKIVNENEIYIGGNFSQFNNNTNLRNLAKYSNTVTGGWTSISGNISDNIEYSNVSTSAPLVFNINIDNLNNIYVSGDFQYIDNNIKLQYLALYDGNSWTSISKCPNGDEINSDVYVVDFSPIGIYGPYIGGIFTEILNNTELQRLSVFNEIFNKYTLFYNSGSSSIDLTNIDDNVCFIYNEDLNKWVILN